MNFLKGNAQGSGAIPGIGAAVPLPRTVPEGTPLTVGIRPAALVLDPNGPLQATVRQVQVLGAETVVHAVPADDSPLTLSLRGIVRLRPGQTLGARVTTPPPPLSSMRRGWPCRMGVSPIISVTAGA